MKYVPILFKSHSHADATLQDNEEAPKAIQEAIDGSSYEIRLGAPLDQLLFMKRQYEGKTDDEKGKLRKVSILAI
jgi:hypothetical protein